MWEEYFTGRTVVVSGGSTGIGAAAASAFARAGALTAILDLADEPGETLAASLRAEGHEVRYRHCDVGDEDDVTASFAWVLESRGAPDVVYANAGIEWTKDVRHTSLHEWHRVLNVNLTGVFLVARAALRVMCDRGSGSIVVTSSPHAVATVPDAGAYAASKGGVHALVRAMSLEGAPYGVRVNGVVPGTIDTPLVRREAQASSNPDAVMAQLAKGQPIGRIGQASDVANVALFLASPLCDFVTGSLFSVDGGLTAGLPSGPPKAYGS